jgi:hypothetical protein
LRLIFTISTQHHSWAKEISNQSAEKFAGVQMATAAQIHAKYAQLLKKQPLKFNGMLVRPGYPISSSFLKALLVANPAEQGFSFFSKFIL